MIHTHHDQNGDDLALAQWFDYLAVEDVADAVVEALPGAHLTGQQATAIAGWIHARFIADDLNRLVRVMEWIGEEPKTMSVRAAIALHLIAPWAVASTSKRELRGMAKSWSFKEMFRQAEGLLRIQK
jgi:hypothetical protein